MTTRHDGRASDALRPIAIEPGTQRHPEGSLVYRSGGTTILISASISEGAPDWRPVGGWITAEYCMHPRASPKRQRRARQGRIDGRSQEIQRLIGRSLRAAVDLERLGPRTIVIDCDVLDADGGTRTASITGGAVALAMALDHLRQRGLVGSGVLRSMIAATSIGLIENTPMLDLCYEEDARADLDLNIVGTVDGGLVEVQGTAETAPIPREQFHALIDLTLTALPTLFEAQQKALADLGIDVNAL